MIENILATLIASLMALTSAGVSSNNNSVVSTPRASAQVTQSTNDNFNLDWRSWGEWRSNKPVIRDIDPEEGPTGTLVTLEGRRFTDDSIVRFAGGTVADPDVSSNGRTLSFSIPEEVNGNDVDPGDYRIRVQDGNKISNAVMFEVTEGTSSDLSILGLDGPTSLDTGEQGTWIVDVESDGDENLSYSVKWGDEPQGLMRLFSTDEEVQSHATFTHTYDDEGTYHPEFTVTDESGNAVQASTTVVVEDEDDNGVPHISSITPDSGAVGTDVTLMGHEFDSDSTVKLGTTSAEDVVVVDDTKITFEVPPLATGTYPVQVTDNDGTSNAVNFTVTLEVNGSVSITGIDAPTRLEEDETGTWTVHADTTSSGNLKYSVDWDEGMSLMSASKDTTQSSATFTHAYDNEGTYNPTFTVTDEFGNSEKVSASVVVEDEDDD